MKKLQTLFVSILLMVVAACSSTYEAKVESDRNQEVDMSQYKTFAWLKDTKILATTPDLNPVMKLRVDKEIEEAFIAQGYTLIKDPEAADFVITYTVGSRDKIKVDTFPTTYHNPWGWGHGYYGGFHSMHMGTETRVRNYTEGKLAIDAFDVKSKQPAWHGAATKRITKADDENFEATINIIVNQIVDKFRM